MSTYFAQIFTDLEILMFALLYANKSEPIKGRLWLQKIMFLIERNVEEIKDVFDGYYIGPFSEEVEIALDQFINSGYVMIRNRNKIYLTKRGREIAESLLSNVSEEKMNIINDMKLFINDLSRIELIAFIYSSFPDWIEESDILEEFNKTRYMASISLLKKNKVSLEKASEISGYPLSIYIEKIKK